MTNCSPLQDYKFQAICSGFLILLSYPQRCIFTPVLATVCALPMFHSRPTLASSCTTQLLNKNLSLSAHFESFMSF